MSGSKAKPTKVRRKPDHCNDDHDEKLCFRCRLFHVMEELYPNGMEGEDTAVSILFCMAELSGMIMSQMDENDFKQFMVWTMKWRDAARRGMVEDGIGETRH